LRSAYDAAKESTLPSRGLPGDPDPGRLRIRQRW